MTHNVRYQGRRSVESSCNPPMWPQSSGFLVSGGCPADQTARRLCVRDWCGLGSSPKSTPRRFFCGSPAFPFSSKTNISIFQFIYTLWFTTVSPHSVHKKTGLHYHRDEIHQLQRSWRKSNSSWNVRKLLSKFLNRQIIKQFKPGSHMPPMHLRHARRYCLGWEQKWPAELVIPVFTVGMPLKLTQVQLRRHAGGKALRLFYLPAAHVLISPRSSPGGTSGYFEDTSAAYENSALHLQTSLTRGIRTFSHCETFKGGGSELLWHWYDFFTADEVH